MTDKKMKKETTRPTSSCRLNVRRAELIDSMDIANLLNDKVAALFGDVVVEHLIETSPFGVTMTGTDDSIVAHASFSHFPNHLKNMLAAWCTAADWPQFFRSNFIIPNVNPFNTMFLHLFVSVGDNHVSILRDALRTLFTALGDVDNILLIVPMECQLKAPYTEYFEQLDVVQSVTQVPDFNVYMTKREKLVPVLYIRPAKVEDNDDLVPIFNRQNEILRKTYGDFFVAELVEAQNENMRCFVAEANGLAVGFMSVSQNVDLALLNKSYHLEYFHGLYKRHPLDVVNPDSDQPAATSRAESEYTTTVQSSHRDSARSDKSTKPTSGTSSSSSSSKSKSSTSSSTSATSSASSSRVSSASGSKSKSSTRQDEQPRSRPSTASSSSSSSRSTKSAESDRTLGEEELDEQALEDEEIVNGQEARMSPKLSDALQPEEPEAPKKDSNRVEVENSFKPPPDFGRANVSKAASVFFGEPNALCIQLFCIDERFESRAVDFLRPVFECFPDRDYLVISVPRLVPEFKLLQSFVHVSPRFSNLLPQELYVFHRAGIIKSFNVRPAAPSDYSAVEKLLLSTRWSGAQTLRDLTAFLKNRRARDGAELQAFVAECHHQVVGVAIVREETEIEMLRAHYNIEDFIYFNQHRLTDHAALLHFALNPAFAHLSRHFLKEILRIGNHTTLYYRVYPQYAPEQLKTKFSMVTCLKELVPISPRRQISYPFTSPSDITNGPIPEVLNCPSPFALYHFNYKLVFDSKMNVNASIVLVGASDVAISFLETLAFCPYIRFNNLTLISPHGLPGDIELDVDSKKLEFLASNYSYPIANYAKLSLRTWCGVVYGKLTAIDRTKKQVVVNGGSRLSYDHLILCTGTQYQAPHLKSFPTASQALSAPTVIRRRGEEEQKVTLQQAGPRFSNQFIISDQFDAQRLACWLERRLLYKRSQRVSNGVVVYGNNVDALSAVHSLLQLREMARAKSPDVSPFPITVLMPPHNDENDQPELDEEVRKYVHQALDAYGVTVFHDCTIVDYDVRSTRKDPHIQTVQFSSGGQPMRLQCEAVLLYAKKNVDFHAFKAMNDACLVYDGRLVIDAQFHTNDLCVRAAGPLTKYQRKYYADSVTHALFSSKAVGKELGRNLLRLFDPSKLEEIKKPEKETVPLVPLLNHPKVQLAVLPGSLKYLHVYKPIVPSSVKLDTRTTNQPRRLTTGSVGGKPPYFTLFINQYQAVESLSYCAPTSAERNPFPNYVSLCGLHQRLLNNVVQRYDEGIINDLSHHFDQSWAMAIFHDRFPALREEIRDLFQTRGADGEASLEEFVRKMLEEDLHLTGAQVEQVREKFLKSGLKKATEKRLLNYLRYNQNHLPMFAWPQLMGA